MIELKIWANGDKFWYCNNQSHRANGPAIVWIDGTSFWFWYGNRVSEFEHMMLSANEQVKRKGNNQWLNYVSGVLDINSGF